MQACEPEGRIRFSLVGAEAPAAGVLGLNPGEHLLRVRVEGLIDLKGAVLRHWSDSPVSQRLLAYGTEAGPPTLVKENGAPRTPVGLGDLVRGKPLILEFAESFAEGTGGVAVISIDVPAGVSTPAFSESAGFIVGEPGPHGVVRAGAIEYPAHQTQEGAP